jgi:hypothetical protein
LNDNFIALGSVRLLFEAIDRRLDSRCLARLKSESSKAILHAVFERFQVCFATVTEARAGRDNLWYQEIAPTAAMNRVYRDGLPQLHGPKMGFIVERH